MAGEGSGRVRVEQEARGDGAMIARVVIDNEAKLNTLGRRMMRELIAALAALAQDETLRAVVLTGAGAKAFIGGADIGEMAALDAASAEAYITLVHQTCDALRLCPVPVIARLNGYTLGAGMEIAAACDLRLASEHARFGMPEVRLGIPSVVEAALLPGLVGWARARELLLLGETYPAAAMERWGFVGRVVPEGELDDAVEDWLRTLLAAGPTALRIQKALMREWENLPTQAAIAAGIPAYVAAYRSDEPAKMMAAFLARRAALKDR
jgi:enoyl-CoA hydratase